MKMKFKILWTMMPAIVLTMCLPVLVLADGSWPKQISTGKMNVIVYQPQSDSMIGDHLYSRAAISFTNAKITTPVFGAIWTDARFSTDRATGTCTIYDVNIVNLRFPGIDSLSPDRIDNIKKVLSGQADSWNLEFSLDEMKSSLVLAKTATSGSGNFKNDPPDIIYLKKKSVLVILDGDPVFQDVENTNLKRAVNTAFLVVQDLKDRSYYLYGGDFWYKAQDVVTGQWFNVQKLPPEVQSFYDQLKKQKTDAQASASDNQPDSPPAKPQTPPTVVVRTHPAELIQSDGEPKYAPIQGTQLLYMTNTDDNIFLTIDKNQYFVLLSGRWYRSSALSGPWIYTESDKLPPDFAKIPEGSDKDIVLASVAGTDAAKDALLDAQIPQTAAVDRKTAQCVVKYDGDPKFAMIPGTELSRALNTSATVLLYRGAYYVCDNAVWFVGNGPLGPWQVATMIPDEFQKIPPDDPSYNVKYVYIYDVQPDIVYVGYTPGYMGCYIFGPTVVYGTGWVYPPFYGPYYYPHPVTFGFSMHYNPWCGWSMGFTMSAGWFSMSFWGPMAHPGGWWGPPMYHPPYHPPYNHYYGPRPPVYRGGGNTININNSRNVNVYNNRSDHSTRPSQQPVISNRGGSAGDRTTPQPANRGGSAGGSSVNRAAGQKNNVYTDQKGNVYRNDNGNWQRNNGKSWESAQPKDNMGASSHTERGGGFNQNEMNQQSMSRDRGMQNMNNRSSMQRPQMSGGGGRRR